MDHLVQEKVRCKPNWQNKSGMWRRDFVWARETNDRHDDPVNAIDGKLLGQLHVIATVQDPERTDDKNKPVRYCGALLKLPRPRNKGIPNEILGMMELQPWTEGRAKTPRMLGSMRFYDVSLILRSVHVVPDGKDGCYINNYGDWDTYNTIYDADFLENGARRANKYRRTHRQ